MKKILIFLVLMTSLSLLVFPAMADTISLDKQKYIFGDTIIVSGNLTFVEGSFVGLQILNPSKSDILSIDQFQPQNNGSFTKSYKAQGPKWSVDGIYTIKLVYDEQVFEKTFQFEKQKATEPKTSTESSTPKTSEPAPKTTKSSNLNTSVDPKLRVQGFPDPHKSPNYYIERYQNDSEYKAWYKTSFLDYSISEIVSYPVTHIQGFPDNKNPPWYYVDRYHKEQVYRDWFDSQFPTKSIYEVLGYPESLFQKVPNWVKNNAKWWSSGLISDSDFLSGIAFLINEGILVVPAAESDVDAAQTIPKWIKNTSQWWSEGKIDENEFLRGIQFLIENGIIRV